MLIGYARVPRRNKKDNAQKDALMKAGCNKIFTDTASGLQSDHPQLRRALECMRKGDVLVVWKLYKLSRSLTHLEEITTELQQRGIGLKSLTENIDTTSV
jgi:DNA invertase Pin-like site-specific DNA recombinase